MKYVFSTAITAICLLCMAAVSFAASPQYLEALSTQIGKTVYEQLGQGQAAGTISSFDDIIASTDDYYSSLQTVTSHIPELDSTLDFTKAVAVAYYLIWIETHESERQDAYLEKYARKAEKHFENLGITLEVDRSAAKGSSPKVKTTGGSAVAVGNIKIAASRPVTDDQVKAVANLSADLGKANRSRSKSFPVSNNSFSSQKASDDKDAGQVVASLQVKKSQPRVSFEHARTTTEAAESITREYGSVPGGVALESVAQGISLNTIKSVVLAGDDGVFIINDSYVYSTGLPTAQIKDLAHAIENDNKIAVSLGSSGDITMGALDKKSDVTTNLYLTDMFLGGIAFGNLERLGLDNYRWEENYEVQDWVGDLSRSAVFFKFTNYTFDTDGMMIYPVSSAINAYFVPLDKSVAGKHLPSYMRIKSLDEGGLKSGFINNLNHLEKHIDYYSREGIVQITRKYGEVAAFLRYVKKAQGGKMSISYKM